MAIAPTVSLGGSVPFKGNQRENRKSNNNGIGLIAASTAIGAGIGAATPDLLFIQNPAEVTEKNLKDMEERLPAYKHMMNERSQRKLPDHISETLGKLGKLGEASLEELAKVQKESFEKLRFHLPTESRIHSGVRGGIIGAVIGTGIVAASKFLEASRPPADIEVNPFKNSEKLNIEMER